MTMFFLLLVVISLPFAHFVWALWRVSALRSVHHYVPPAGYEWRSAGLRSPGLVELEKIPGHVILAIVYYEDYRFFLHHGVSFPAIKDRLRKFLQGARLAGGSSITQQLVKNIFVGNDPTLRRKYKEVVYAAAVEYLFSKEQILSLYLSTIRLGPAIYGLERGSRLYFGVDIRHLTFQEAVILASIIPSPIAHHRSLWVERKTQTFDVADLFIRLTTLIHRLHAASISLNNVEEITYEQAKRVVTMQVSRHVERGIANEIEEQAAVFCHQVLRRMENPNRSWEVPTKMIQTLGAEDQFLVVCIQRSFGVNRPYFMNSMPNSEQFVALVKRHSLVPLVFRELRDSVPQEAEIKRLLHSDARAMSQMILRQQGEIARLAQAFHDAQCDVVFLKGIQLSLRFCGDVNARQPGDIDIAVRRQDAVAACAVLESLGYVSNARHSLSTLASKGAALFVGEGRTPIDLHCSLIEPRFDVDLPGIWDERASVEINGISIPVLSPIDELLFLALHGSKHLWGRIGWIVDFAKCALSLSEDQWRAAYEKASTLKIQRQLEVAVVLVRDLTDTHTIPPELPRVTLKSALLARRIIRNLFGPPHLRNRVENTRLSIELQETVGRKASYILGRLFASHDPDATLGQLARAKVSRLFEKSALP